MPEVVRQAAAVESTPTVSFDFSPHGAAFSYSSSLATYSPAGAFYAATNTSLTFTSSVTFGRSSEYVTGYEWNFGDGNRGFGASVSHTFKNPGSTQVSLTVVDNKGKRWHTRKQLYLTGLGSYRNLVLELDPSLYWPLDVTYGATDQSGNGHNGTAAGGVSIGGFSSSPFAGETTCTDFDGVDDRITSTFNPFANGGSTSYSAWINRDTNTTNDTILAGSAGASQPHLRMLASSDTARFLPADGGTAADWTSSGVSTTTWNHLVLTFDEPGNLAYLYRNGVLLSSQASPTAFNATPGNLLVGSRISTTDPFDGKIVHLAVFPRLLTAAEAYSLYTG